MSLIPNLCSLLVTAFCNSTSRLGVWSLRESQGPRPLRPDPPLTFTRMSPYLGPLWVCGLSTCALSLSTLTPPFPNRGPQAHQEAVWDETMSGSRNGWGGCACGRGLGRAVDMGARGDAARDLAQRYVREAQSQGAQVSRGTDSGVPGEEGA